MTKYPYAFAQYPESFKECMVSPTKICLQFNDPEIKLRPLGADRSQFSKLDGDIYVPVTDQSQHFELTAVGCQMPVIEDLQHNLIQAYEHYFYNHKDTYEQTYNKPFSHFIERLKGAIDRLDILISNREEKNDNPV